MQNEVRELPLSGVRLLDLTRHPDERGVFTEIMRSDWKSLLGEDPVLQANLSVTYPSIVRAWHRHKRGQADYFLTLKGTVKVCIYDEEEAHLLEAVLSEARMQVLRVPGHYWHGFKVVSPEPAYLVYFVNRLYDYKMPDEERRPWDDPQIVPRKINGRTDDPRCNKPWDWFYPSHR
ncbi:MAG: dTDP-4-dehydrorhamnose 3,5-epimerase family protein [Candidatus Brockarchaeota archaeon]|nr:dTDP-4-dehydrorhamnose 3,5-epimerase family protein [Candidatus Brockarchaeota archaeon]